MYIYCRCIYSTVYTFLLVSVYMFCNISFLLTNKRGQSNFLALDLTHAVLRILLVPLVRPVDNDRVVAQAAQTNRLNQMAKSLLHITRHKTLAEALQPELAHLVPQSPLALSGLVGQVDVAAAQHTGTHKQALASLELSGEGHRVRMLHFKVAVVIFVVALVVVALVVVVVVVVGLAGFGQEENLWPPVFDVWWVFFEAQQCVSSSAH